MLYRDIYTLSRGHIHPSPWGWMWQRIWENGTIISAIYWRKIELYLFTYSCNCFQYTTHSITKLSTHVLSMNESITFCCLNAHGKPTIQNFIHCILCPNHVEFRSLYCLLQNPKYAPSSESTAPAFTNITWQRLLPLISCIVLLQPFTSRRHPSFTLNVFILFLNFHLPQKRNL